MDDLWRSCWVDPECPEYGKCRVGNLTVSHRYGLDKSRSSERNSCYYSVPCGPAATT